MGFSLHPVRATECGRKTKTWRFPLRERTGGRTDGGGASRPRACACERALRVNANIATTHQEEEAAATDWAGTELLGEISTRRGALAADITAWQNHDTLQGTAVWRRLDVCKEGGLENATVEGHAELQKSLEDAMRLWRERENVPDRETGHG